MISGKERTSTFLETFPETFLEKLSHSDLAVFTAITENPRYKTEELAVKLGVTRRTITNRIKSLKEKGVIQRIGSDRNGYWEIIIKGKGDDQ